jgi:uncharacterized glyoxalase superfamily protein PhnB
MDQRITLITLATADMARARRFYETPGWQAHAGLSQDEVTFFQLKGFVLGLYKADMLAADTGLSAPRPGGITLAINLRSEAEVQATLDEAVAAGGTVLAAPRRMPWGGVVGYFADPDGHPWEVTWLDAFPLDADGGLTLPA